VFAHLQLSDPRERWLVGAADLGLAALAPVVRPWRGRGGGRDPQRILLLRLERVGDLVMTLDAIGAVRDLAPRARVDLVVGGWNAALAGLIPGLDRVETLDAPWLAREAKSHSVPHLLSRAWSWRARRYDLAINFEGDIRSNVLIGLSGAMRRVGFDMAGGGALLTDRVEFDARAHTRANALRLVGRAFGLEGDGAPARSTAPRLAVPEEARARARALLEDQSRAGQPLVALHAGGGREIKQWALARFADVASRLSRSLGARIVLTGTSADRPHVEAVRQALDPASAVIDLAGRADLVTLAALLEQMDLLVTGDTGPMHLAAALDVPVVAIFGPSDPARWGPEGPRTRVVRAQLPCSPCNRIRQPPARCRGHVPECLAAVSADAVYDAAVALLAR
jgi:lipopolysaccharide heptosyltransferase II